MQLNHKDTENTEQKHVLVFFPWFTRWVSGATHGESPFFGFLCASVSLR